jgi:hypothetical protein
MSKVPSEVQELHKDGGRAGQGADNHSISARVTMRQRRAACHAPERRSCGDRERAVLCNASLPGGAAGAGRAVVLKAGTGLNSGRVVIGETSRAVKEAVEARFGLVWQGIRARIGSRHSKIQIGVRIR